MKVSVVVPIYNNEKYLRKSIECIMKQTYFDIEIILVNNGSKDNSLHICNEYAEKDSRIAVIDVFENIGAGEARNRGIDVARGEYIVFLDADDWYELSMIETLLSAVSKSNSDVAVCGYETYIEGVGSKNKERFSPAPHRLTTSADVRTFFSKSFPDGMAGFLWNKIYKLSVIRENDIRFPNTVRLEDGFFNIDFFANAKSCVIISDVLYHYRISNQADLSRKYAPEYFEIVEKLTEYFIGMRHNWNMDGIELDNVYKFYINELGSYAEAALTGRWKISNRDIKTKLTVITDGKQYIEAKRYLHTVGKYRQVLIGLLDKKNYFVLKTVIRVKIFLKGSFKPMFYLIRRNID